MNYRGVGLVMLAAFTTLSLMGCSKTETQNFSLMMNNQSKENWSLWFGESESPEGKGVIIPGGFQPATVGLRVFKESETSEDAKFQDHIKLHASKDGSNVTNFDLDIRMPVEQGRTLYARWDGKYFSVGY
ncbi:MAG: hypothetical protein WCK01_03370 [Candidatus Uhrbacteria bacterium]